MTDHLDLLRRHTCWDAAMWARREGRIARAATRSHRKRHNLAQAMMFLGAANGALALLWNLHNQHPTLILWLVVAACIAGYYAHHFGLVNLPPERTVALWREKAGNEPLDAQQWAELDDLLDTCKPTREIVRAWISSGHRLQQRDAAAVRRCVQSVAVADHDVQLVLA